VVDNFFCCFDYEIMKFGNKNMKNFLIVFFENISFFLVFVVLCIFFGGVWNG